MLQWRIVVNNDDNVTGVNTWSNEEDGRLTDLVGLFGLKWSVVAQLLPGREAKQTRERFLNVIDPGKVRHFVALFLSMHSDILLPVHSVSSFLSRALTCCYV